MTLPTGIVRTKTGYRAFVRVAQGTGGLKSKCFPRTAGLREMKQWREATRVAHRQDPRPKTARGTLAADIERYLQIVAAMPSIADRTRDLAAWREVLGPRARGTLTRADLQLILHEWRLTGSSGRPLAASTVNHRRTALMHLYAVLDGRAAPNPLRDIPTFPEPPAEPRAIALVDIKTILAKLPRTKTRARLKVLAWTGIRGSSELGKMKPEHVDLEQRICWVPTGKHGKPRQLVLNAAGVTAWREFFRLKAWGPYSKDSLRRTFQRAVAKVNADREQRKALPLPRLRVYDLRHSIATALIRAGADLADVQAHLGHSNPRMTRRYAPFQSAKLRAALHKLK